MTQVNESTFTKRLRAASERVKAKVVAQHQTTEKTSQNAAESATEASNNDVSKNVSEDAIARQVRKVARTQGIDAAYQLNILLRMRELLGTSNTKTITTEQKETI